MSDEKKPWKVRVVGDGKLHSEWADEFAANHARGRANERATDLKVGARYEVRDERLEQEAAK